jgi:uncharacterized protein YceH (UPF0502 family)
MDASVVLGEVEIRVLGVLIEKALTSPSAYPMTVNSIVAGANQLQNREPVVGYSESEVSHALRNLEHKGLVTQAATTIGARSVRFEHRVLEKFAWDRREQAVMTELMLRGHQTAGELRTRASRMTSLPDLQAVVGPLEALKNRTPPFVEELPREPGRSANRFRHLLCPESATDHPAGPRSLEARVAKLEAEMAALHAVLGSRSTSPASDQA